MNETTARRWAYAAAAAGLIANSLFVAFFVSYALQDFGDPYGAAADFGSASDYAGIPQDLLMGVVTVVVCRYLSRRQRLDRALQILGAVTFAAATVSGVLTVSGVQPGGDGPLAVGPVIASAIWLLAIGSRGTRLPDLRRVRAARIGRLIAATMLGCAALVLFGLGINVTAVVWAALFGGGLAWFAIPFWALAVGRALTRSRIGGPISENPVNQGRLNQSEVAP
jgi:hypothetical protein